MLLCFGVMCCVLRYLDCYVRHCMVTTKYYLTLFDMGRGAMMAPRNVFDHCAQTLSRRKLKLGDF